MFVTESLIYSCRFPNFSTDILTKVSFLAISYLCTSRITVAGCTSIIITMMIMENISY
jgi:hypothetical protein